MASKQKSKIEIEVEKYTKSTQSYNFTDKKGELIFPFGSRFEYEKGQNEKGKDEYELLQILQTVIRAEGGKVQVIKDDYHNDLSHNPKALRARFYAVKPEIRDVLIKKISPEARSLLEKALTE